LLEGETGDEVASDNQGTEREDGGVEEGGSEEEPCIMEEKSSASEFNRLSV